MKPGNRKPSWPWPIYLCLGEKLEALLQLCAYTLSCSNRASVLSLSLAMGVHAKFATDFDSLEYIGLCRICALFKTEQPQVEEWLARQRCRYNCTMDSRPQELICLLGLELLSRMSKLPGTLLECVWEDRLIFDSQVQRLKLEPKAAEDALQPGWTGSSYPQRIP